ncbi:MAG: 16S rRNA (uracil(1498)-N(3))-methyltransferase [Flavobacteriaceae bacterium]|nr:16S rRNA (uracil(1498)-N(3))-methyltransferase [Flavobacteriaceae bacterium]
MNLFYQKGLLETTKSVVFDKDESRHLQKVLRYKTGDKVSITNGLGGLFTATLVEVNQKQCVGTIIEYKKVPPLPYQLHMAVAPTKNNDRFEWFLEKTTEIGVAEITPIICDHSERKVVKLDRFEKIIESAMKQSLKMYKPILHPAISFSDFCKFQLNTRSKKYIAHCYHSEKKLLKDYCHPNESSIILIGPEGDFSTNEIEFSEKNGFIPISFGESRLRTETAAIVACSTVYNINLT